MASMRLPGRCAWHNPQSRCQVPSDPRRRMGAVCQLAWSSRCFPRPVPQEVPRQSPFLVRPHLLTRFAACTLAWNTSRRARLWPSG
jgi:hypothetical protein